jgi:[calcium/calmodulin-dependent protein kinase] kinase
MNPLSRRSEEAFHHHKTAHSSHDNGPLTAARRASSWGENSADFVEEVTSLNSDDHEIDEDAMLFGAGGICNDRSELTVSPRLDMGYGSSPRQRPDRSFVAQATTDSHDCPTTRHPLARSHNTSPLTQIAYGSEGGHMAISGGNVDDEFDDDYSSSVEDFGESMGGLDEDSDEDVPPIEVRRRFLASPPPSSPESDDGP